MPAEVTVYLIEAVLQNDDGSITVHMGGCDDGLVNCIPITSSWSYAVRHHQPRADIFDGSWSFPAFEPAN